MRRYILALLILSIPFIAYAQYAPITEFVEEDGSPSTYPYKVVVDDGSLTDNLDSTINIKTVGTITTTTKFCIDTDNDTCWFKTDNNTSVLTINDYVAIKMLRTTLAFHLLLDDGVGAFDLLLDDGSGSFTLVIE